jgi:8-oxo-dGTP diphosphatase
MCPTALTEVSFYLKCYHYIMKQLPPLNPENVTEQEAREYNAREAVRAIVFDQDNLIALIHVSRDNYYKLPGGGLDDEEDHITGLKRECQEELGCDIEVVREVASMNEYWKPDRESQISYCYIAQIVGEKGTPHLTENELVRGFKTVWVPYEEALRLMAETKPTNYEGDYIIPRDMAFLKAAQEFIK